MVSRTIVYVAFIAVSILFIVYYVNIMLFCKDSSQIDLNFFNIDCGLIPDKQTQVDKAFSTVCNDFRTNYNCNMDLIDTVTTEYAELGKPARAYSLIELCHLKNQYYFNTQCATLCGCTGA